MEIQWYPGHMAKTKRELAADLKLVDIVCEILDARIPQSSRNPDIIRLSRGKPGLIILNRVDQADPAVTYAWAMHFKSKNYAVIETDAKTGAGVSAFLPAARALVADKIKRLAERGAAGRAVKVMIVGIPNVGKSTFINRLVGKKSAKAEDRPGVTRSRQWFAPPQGGVELLDTPGVLWPKFEDEKTGLHLAFTGAIRDEILDVETLAAKLFETLKRKAPGVVALRYKFDPSYCPDGFSMLKAAALKRGFLISGGEPDLERTARIVLDEFRGGRLGRLSLESPDELPEDIDD